MDRLEKKLERLKKKNQLLESMVEDKTRELFLFNETLQNMLNNLAEGFLVFDNSGTILPGCTKATLSFFNCDPTNKIFATLMNEVKCEKKAVDRWTKLLFKDVLAFPEISILGPKYFENKEGQYIEMQYRPIYKAIGKEKILVKVICILSDKTKERKFQIQARKEKALVKMILSVLKDRQAFIETMIDVKKLLTSLKTELKKESSTIDLKLLFRQMHSIKGGLANYYIINACDMAHNMETDLSNIQDESEIAISEYLPNLMEGIELLNLELSEFLNQNKDLIGGPIEQKIRNKIIDMDQILKMHTLIRDLAGEESKVYQSFIDDFLIEDISTSFERYEDMIQRIAWQQGKKVRFTIKPSPIKLYLDHYSSVISSFVHVFRNAIDHGIESVNERSYKNKPKKGNLSVSFEKRPDRDFQEIFAVVIEDDGRGLDAGIIKSAAIKKGIVQEDEADSLDDNGLYQLIFRAGFSSKEKVSELSGRGVGLDALNYEVVKLGGNVLVESTKDKGTKFIVELPVYKRP